MSDSQIREMLEGRCFPSVQVLEGAKPVRARTRDGRTVCLPIGAQMSSAGQGSMCGSESGAGAGSG